MSAICTARASRLGLFCRFSRFRDVVENEGKERRELEEREEEEGEKEAKEEKRGRRNIFERRRRSREGGQERISCVIAAVNFICAFHLGLTSSHSSHIRLASIYFCNSSSR